MCVCVRACVRVGLLHFFLNLTMAYLSETDVMNTERFYLIIIIIIESVCIKIKCLLYQHKFTIKYKKITDTWKDTVIFKLIYVSFSVNYMYLSCGTELFIWGYLFWVISTVHSKDSCIPSNPSTTQSQT